MDLALACDICLIGPSGWLMQGWGRVGLIPGTGGTLLLSRRVGQQQAWRTLVDSERIKPDRAEQLGIGSAVWETSAAEEAVQLLRRFDVLPTSALRRYVQLMRQPLANALEPHLSDCLSAQLELLTGPDFLNRAEAALAGREPGRPRA
jgi:enoyl-CoA hydratase/carnithine racemase